MSSRTKPLKSRTQIIHLLGNPTLTHAQIAKSLGISTKTVQRVAREIRPEVEEADGKLAEYGRLVRRRLPIADRVDLYDRIARKADSNPFAAMRALERVDELDGILTAKDEAKQRLAPAPTPQPMFILPPGTRIEMSGSQMSDWREKAPINITPEPETGDCDSND